MKQNDVSAQAGTYLEVFRKLFEMQAGETDFDRFNADRFRVNIGQTVTL